jgi:hypothetical protein
MAEAVRKSSTAAKPEHNAYAPESPVTSAAIFLKKHLAVDFVTGRTCGISVSLIIPD